MNTTDSPDAMDSALDAALERLPEWRPPPHFSARLAAAAARQVEQKPGPSDPPAIFIWLDQITRSTPAMLASACLAVTAGWIVPWSQLSIGATVWTCVLAMASAGAVLTMRVLRAA